MTKNTRLLQERLRKLRDKRLLPRVFAPSQPVRIAAYHHNAEPIGYAEAVHQEYQPFEVGDTWGRGWATTWFRVTCQVPEQWAGRAVTLIMRLNSAWYDEGLVYKEEKPFIALDHQHEEVPLTEKAKGGEEITLYIEATANVSSSKWLGEDGRPHYSGKELCRLEKAFIAVHNGEIHDFTTDFSVLFDTMMALPEDSPRRAQMLFELNEMANQLDLEDPESVKSCRATLSTLLKAQNAGSQLTCTGVGHAHIDSAWLWPLRETIRKCARTFSTQLRLMEKYPDYVFACSQPQQYEWMKKHYPAIYKDIKAAVRKGRWEPVGSMWIEADCNIPSGESLVRQILLGKRFFQEEFGIDTKDLWLPDVFGYAASLPQILRKSGVDYFLTQKISWNQYNKFPHHTFLWEGIDGTDIFTHFPPNDTYNDFLDPTQVIKAGKQYREKDRSRDFLMVYGYGDGGGGPTEEMLRNAERLKDLEGVPKVELKPVREFFPALEADAKATPRWVGELYLELHRGTFTTHARNKRGNRKSELLLRDAEFFAALDVKSTRQALKKMISDGRQLPPQPPHDCADPAPTLEAVLTRAWKLLLLNQFHDIIPGSSITWVYRDSEEDYQAIGVLGAAVMDAGIDTLLQKIDTSQLEKPVVILNTLPFERREVVRLPNGKLTLVEVPSCGYATVNSERAEHTPLPDGIEPVNLKQRGEESDEIFVLENGLVRVTLDRQGLIAGFTDLRNHREVLAPGSRGNLLQVHEDIPNNWEAWDIDIFYRQNTRDLTEPASPPKILQSGPLRATLEIKREFGKSTITQKIILEAGSPVLTFDTVVDWQEDQTLLKAAFPVDVHADFATYEVQFGHVRRPNHYNTSWDEARFEVAAQQWAALTETGYGVALLNDCKYGYDILGNVMRLSLLRSPRDPDPKADLGRHTFRYGLYPFAGGVAEGRVVEQARAFNSPMPTRACGVRNGSLPELQSFVEIDRPGVMLSSLKPAEDGKGWIIRVYEAHGSRGQARVHVNLPVKKAARTTMLEEDGEEIKMTGRSFSLQLRPFEIVTLRLW
jgi:alpha-mannosidase